MNSDFLGDPDPKDAADGLDVTRIDPSNSGSTEESQTRDKPVDNRTEKDAPFSKGDKIGRYVVVKELGAGGFGHVYLARDPKLFREVAIKYPRLDRAKVKKAIFLEEGRSVARLDHPSIVKIFNIEETENGNPFVVMEYVNGPTLRNLIAEKGLSFNETLNYLIQIADALSYAHDQTLIHRDLKPANVIITEDGLHAKLTDFGMALHDLTPEEFLPKNTEGTPPYMAPEQIRGENHRLDRRTDIWSFGVMAYVMLTGQKPFRSKKISNLIQAICVDEPKPPRHIKQMVPEELERICLKCLEKLMSSRYQSTKELVDDLKSFRDAWQGQSATELTISSSGISPTSLSKPTASATDDHSGQSTHSANSVTAETNLGDTQTVKVVPKGLRSFDGQDAVFFLNLLPGPKDRHGIPESLRFWMTRISKDADEPISVGLIFGPSGCGKSSFVKAGLIPRLEGVKTVYVEASPHDTEQRILDKLERVAPQVVKSEDTLTRVFTRLRRGQSLMSSKILVVIDQFEQWLHNHQDLTNKILIEALRQCDGKNLSCIILVRDDFWMSATQFMAQLDLKVQEGVNALGIPLFSQKHARRVLKAYGQANEAFDHELTPDQVSFINRAIKEMSNNGRVIPIHLALFSQMMDSDSWDADQLEKIGGWKRLGVHFLDTIFAEKRAANYEDISRSILQQLLPEVGSKIKGAKKSIRQLLQFTPGQSEEKLQGALDLLDRESRIITPTESDADETGRHYQLAHDYLVEPLRQWLTQKEQQTREGRARLRLEELSSQWQFKKENRFLPGPLEYVTIRTSINKKTCSPPQKEFLKSTGNYYSLRGALVIALVASIGLFVISLLKTADRQQARQTYESLIIASPDEVEVRMQLLGQFDEKDIVNFATEQHAEATPRAKLHAMLVRSRFGKPADVPLAQLIGTISAAESGECENIISALQTITGTARESELFPAINTRFKKSTSAIEQFRLAVISLHLGQSDLAKQLLAYELNPESRVHFIEQYPGWHGNQTDVVKQLTPDSKPCFLSGLILSLGQIPAEQFDDSILSALNSSLTKLTETAASPDVHSSARWALESLGAKLKLGRLRSPDSSWLVKQFGPKHQMTFVRVEPHLVYKGFGLDSIASRHTPPEEIVLEHSFHIAAREVSVTHFYEFIATLKTDDPVRVRYEANVFKKYIGQDIPMGELNWVAAARFCNWLSEKEGLRPQYAESKKTYGGDAGGVHHYWKHVPFANGYRMPTSFEWEAAGRCGTNTRYLFGEKYSRINLFAVTAIHPSLITETQVASRGLRMPNPFGIFDMNGNVSEWCHDHLGRQIQDSTNRANRGGESTADERTFQAGTAYFPNMEDGRSFNAGIRLVIEMD